MAERPVQKSVGQTINTAGFRFTSGRSGPSCPYMIQATLHTWHLKSTDLIFKVCAHFCSSAQRELTLLSGRATCQG